MPDFKIVNFHNTQQNNELLIAFLDELQFDSYEEIDDSGLKAYVLTKNFDEKAIQSFLSSLPIFDKVSFEVFDLENKNWNEEWEHSFKPISIGSICMVRAPFHPQSNAKYELVIEPKMAFGTGHHATTEMVLALMLEMDFRDKTVLDFGCGTGILSLLAEKKEAKHIDANDIEEPAYHNTVENAQLNNCHKITAYYGDISVLPKKTYDVILANVTTNTIKENLDELCTMLNKGGDILLSGILLEQQSIVKSLAMSLKLNLLAERNQDNWVALHYQKS